MLAALALAAVTGVGPSLYPCRDGYTRIDDFERDEFSAVLDFPSPFDWPFWSDFPACVFGDERTLWNFHGLVPDGGPHPVTITVENGGLTLESFGPQLLALRYGTDDEDFFYQVDASMFAGVDMVFGPVESDLVVLVSAVSAFDDDDGGYTENGGGWWIVSLPESEKSQQVRLPFDAFDLVYSIGPLTPQSLVEIAVVVGGNGTFFQGSGRFQGRLEIRDMRFYGDVYTCEADLSRDGVLNTTDVNLFVSAFLANTMDYNCDGARNNTDINEFVSDFLTDCTPN